MLRARIPYLTLALGTIAIGLALQRGGSALQGDVRDVLGDALWAAMITWWVGAAVPNMRSAARSLTAIGICWAVELSQLYHTPMLDGWRSTTLGHLVLGTDFDVRDLASYLIGVAAATGGEVAWRSFRGRKRAARERVAS